MPPQYHWSDPRHAAWAYARTVLMLAALGGLLYFHAIHPDWTEIRTLIEAIALFVGGQLVHGRIKAAADKKEEG